MGDQFPRPSADEEEREACETIDRFCNEVNASGRQCTRTRGHAGDHVVGLLDGTVLTRWPDAPIVEPVAVVLRGVAWHRFEDGGMSIAIAGNEYGRAAGERYLHLSPDEAKGLNVGDKVTIKIEVTRG